MSCTAPRLLTICLVALLTGVPAHGAEPGGPVYQRRSSVWDGDARWHGEWYGVPGRASAGAPATWQHQAKGQHHGHPATSRQHPTYQQHSSFSFQRPYPYHLDYYRMKYGGSYAPYFGNLYGPPNVYAPAYFGGQPYAPSEYGHPAPADYYGPPPYVDAAPTEHAVVESVPSVPAPPAESVEP